MTRMRHGIGSPPRHARSSAAIPVRTRTRGPSRPQRSTMSTGLAGGLRVGSGVAFTAGPPFGLYGSRALGTCGVHAAPCVSLSLGPSPLPPRAARARALGPPRAAPSRARRTPAPPPRRRLALGRLAGPRAGRAAVLRRASMPSRPPARPRVHCGRGRCDDARGNRALPPRRPLHPRARGTRSLVRAGRHRKALVALDEGASGTSGRRRGRPVVGAERT